MFHLPVVLEKGHVVGGGLDAKYLAELVVHLDRGVAEAIAQVGSRAGRSTRRADRTQATDAPAPCSPAGGSGAVDDPPAPSPPGPRSRPGHLSDDPARASDSLSLRACSGHRKSNRWRILQGFFR